MLIGFFDWRLKMSGKCSIRVDKVKSIIGLDNHNNRIKLKDDAKPYIDESRSNLNYDLFWFDDNYEKTINEKLNNAGLTRKIRKDSALAGSFVINAPTKDNHQLNKEFFIDCLKFIAKLVGESNIIAAKVHNDEKTPHLHLVFVPISKKLNKKNETIKTLSYNDFFGKKKQLQDLQTNFYLEVGKKYGLARGVKSDKKHIETREYRAEKERVEKLNELEKIDKFKIEIEKEKKELEKINKSVKSQVEKARSFFNELNELEKENTDLEKTYGGFLGWNKKALWKNFNNSRIAGKILAEKINDFENAAQLAENKAKQAESLANKRVCDAESVAEKANERAKKATERADEVENNFNSMVKNEVENQMKNLTDEKINRLNERRRELEKENYNLKEENEKMKCELDNLENKLNDWNKLWENADKLYERVKYLENLKEQKELKKQKELEKQNKPKITRH